MWESKFSPGQYVEGHKSLPIVLSRSYHPTRNDYLSTYGVWNDGNGLRGCGLWDDVIFQNFRNVEGRKSRSSKKNANKSILRSTIPNRQFRFNVLATPKKSGCGTNCKASRCATIEYAKPYCAIHKQKQKKSENKLKTNAHLKQEKIIYTTMENIHIQDRIHKDENHNRTIDLKNLKKVNPLGYLESLSITEQNCKRNCSECSNAPQKLIETRRYNLENINRINDIELKPLDDTRTVGCNIEKNYIKDKDYEIPRRVLKNVNNNVMKELLKNSTSSIPRVKIPTSIPRVAFLCLPKPEPYKHLNKLAIKMIKYAIGKDQISTPQPKSWNKSPPNSLTSQRTTLRKVPLETQKLILEKLAPRSLTPPTSIPSTQTPNISPQSQQEKPQKQIKAPQLQPILYQISNEVSRKSSKQSSEQSSNFLTSTTSYFDTTSEEISDNHSNNYESLTPMYCFCNLCGKLENGTNDFQMNRTIYHNNPLYSPLQSLTRQTNSNLGRTMNWRFFYIILEVVIWVMLGGALILGLIPYVESLFRAYVVDFCRCSYDGVSKGRGVPHVNVDGMQSGIVKWITCMMDDNRTTLTPLK